LEIRGRRRTRRLVPSAAMLACVPWLSAFAVSGRSPLDAMRSPGIFAIVVTDALVFEAIMVTIAAPIAGAAIASSSDRSGRTTLSRLLLALAAFMGTSFIVGLGAAQAGALNVTVLVQSRVALAATTLALASLGALCAAVFVDVLDAAGAALVAALVAATGLIGSGPAGADLTERAINVGLLASPVIAATSAARIDLLRSAALYQLSPIAHRRFEYPGWVCVSVSYLLVAGCCLIAMAWKLRGYRPRIA
jgi:hypothetical protein